MSLVSISIVLINLFLVVISGWGNFCSTMCGNSCTGDFKNNCKSCQSDGAWINSAGNTCSVNPATNWYVHGSTGDLGGSLSVGGATLNDTCYDFLLYGYVKTDQIITVSTPGISVPYYSMKVYFGIIAFESACWGCGGGGANTYNWDNSSAFLLKFNDP